MPAAMARSVHGGEKKDADAIMGVNTLSSSAHDVLQLCSDTVVVQNGADGDSEPGAKRQRIA